MLLYNVLCSKGGVGKSTQSIGLIHTLLNMEKSVHVIETDNSNPDVGLIYQNDIPVSPVCLDEKSGWMLLMDLMEDIKEEYVVVNGAARHQIAWKENGHLLESAAEYLGVEMTTVWVVDPKHDSLQQLSDFISFMANHRVVASLNLYWGDITQFWRWRESEVQNAVAAQILLPSMADRCADLFTSQKMSPAKALESKQLRLADRIELNAWIRKVADSLQGILE